MTTVNATAILRTNNMKSLYVVGRVACLKFQQKFQNLNVLTVLSLNHGNPLPRCFPNIASAIQTTLVILIVMDPATYLNITTTKEIAVHLLLPFITATMMTVNAIAILRINNM